MRPWVVALVAFCAGCRGGFDLLTDGGPDSLVDPDAPTGPDAPVGPCVARWLAGQIMVTPQSLPTVNTADPEYTPFIDFDNDTLYFTRTDAAGTDVYKATRSADFADVTPVPDLSSPAVEGSITLSVDGLVATVATERDGGTFPGRDLWEATRGSTADPFSGFTTAPFVDVNTAGSELEFWTSLDRLRIYISAEIAGQQRITLASRSSTNEPFGPPVIISEINSGDTQCCHSLTGDERVLVFASVGGGAIQLFYATRASIADPFSPPRAVPTIIPPSGFDLHTSLTSDGCTLYFSSTRPGAGGFDLWMSDL